MRATRIPLCNNEITLKPAIDKALRRFSALSPVYSFISRMLPNHRKSYHLVSPRKRLARLLGLAWRATLHTLVSMC